jgi:alpha-tubulin suppressor-like RCC1 family protein
VITEIMAHPGTAEEAPGEWLEVYNAGRVKIDLNGYAIASGGDAGYTIAGPLVVASGEYLVLGASTDDVASGGAGVRHAYTGISLGNDAGDWLALRAPTGIAVDSVSWGAAPGDAPAAPPAGIARALASTDSPNVNLSGAHAAWIDAVGTYGPALWRGTPGAANPLGVRGGISIAAGSSHVCMADRDGAAWCWGVSWGGQLGTGSYDPVMKPTRVRVATPAGVQIGRVVAGEDMSCGLSLQADAYCWGGPFEWTVFGRTYAYTPRGVPNPGTSLITSVASGGGLCLVDASGEAFCRYHVASHYHAYWFPLSPLLPGAVQITQVALGDEFACALAGGRVYCFGENHSGQLGDGTTVDRPSLVEARLPQGVAFRSVAATGATVCALSEAGQAYCWGRNSFGHLGIGTSDGVPHPLPVPVQQPAGVAFTAVSLDQAGYNGATCGLTADGQAWCWGGNLWGQLGDGTNTDRLVPTAVVQREVRFSAIAVGVAFACALEEGTGQPFCWGANYYGQLGDGSFRDRLLPVPTIR